MISSLARLASVRIWLMAVIATAVVTIPTLAMAATEEAGGGHHEEEFNPINEFGLRTYIDLQVGPVDMSVNQAVVGLWLAAIICCGFAVWQARRMHLRPTGTQTFVETIYEFIEDKVANQTLGPKVYSRYMPYVASLFAFLWVANLISFIPLPFGEHSWVGEQGGPHIPDLAFYAATSNLNVTITLALVTFIATHYEGLRINGPRKYFASWAPPGSFLLKAFIWPLHALGELLRLASLSVRLFANMLAGHLLIILMLALIIIIGALPVALGTVPVALAFYLFEFVLIATLQAFIFAMLSGIYIGGAAEAAH